MPDECTREPSDRRARCESHLQCNDGEHVVRCVTKHDSGATYVCAPRTSESTQYVFAPPGTVKRATNVPPRAV